MPCRLAIRSAFTLVELLVVIFIIALLLALLLPSLGSAKIEALRVKTGVNMRSMIQGFVSYAGDNKATLPGEAPKTGPGAILTPGRTGVRDVAVWHPPSTWAKNSSDRVLYDALDNYGGLAATEHPSAGAPSWKSSSFGNPTAFPAGSGPTAVSFALGPNNFGTVGSYPYFAFYSSPWSLHFGYDGWRNYGSGTNTTPYIHTATSLRLDNGTARSLMMMDAIWVTNPSANGSNDAGYYVYSHRKGAASAIPAYGTDGNPDQSTAENYGSNKSTQQWMGLLSGCSGGFAGTYDGAVTWKPGPVPYRRGPSGTDGQANNLAAPLPDGWIWKSSYNNGGGVATAAVGDF